eukprot:TRINITY_DN50866_c0_g1_i1.p1 TRINITY_DN50866_c0_g1~~TRINITY_DN50866_c0_g1_i1.p1  ORF type:complete len:468 (-),score=52.26 TRINITY_DN50866_c0_g1_i1:182-1585(-)
MFHLGKSTVSQMHLDLLTWVLLLAHCLLCVGWGVSQDSELDAAEFVILHDPSAEVAVSSLHPGGALYEDTSVSVQAAKTAHMNFRNAIQKYEVDTVTVGEIISGNIGQWLSRSDMLFLAMVALQYNFHGNLDELTDEEKYLLSDDYKRQALQGKTGQELYQIVITRPTVHLEKAEKNTPLVTVATTNRPLSNLVFTRDQQIITRRGLVLGRLNSFQRNLETRLMGQVWKMLAVPILANMTAVEGAFLEGGDFVPVSPDIAYVGIGLRSTWEAVEHMLTHDLFGTRRVAVVKDELDHNQDRMHLDTFFNVVDETRVVVLEDILGENSPKRRMVDVYEQGPDCKYRKTIEDVEFSLFLKREGFQIIPATNAQQLKYFINFVNLGHLPSHPHGVIISVHPDLGSTLKNYGYKGEVEYVDYRGITVMYGAAHCTSQVNRKKPPAEPCVPQVPDFPPENREMLGGRKADDEL